MVKLYDRARKWVTKNMNPKKYKTYQDFLVAVLNQQGFNQISNVAGFAKGIRTDHGDKFKFQTQQELKNYIAAEKKRIKEEQEALERLENAKDNEDIEKEITIVQKPKERPAVAPVPQQKGFLGRLADGVKGFFKGFLGRK